MVYQSTWDDTAEQTLRRWVAEGASSSVIAEAMRRTRSAVSGKISRLKLKRPEGRSPMRKVSTKQPPKAEASVVLAPKPARKLAPIEAVNGKPVPFLQAKRFHCRAVLDERGEDGLAMFCGAKMRPGSSWCPKHHRLFVTYGRA
ncbi:GcrA family cell cycle regulator [Bradyrhizobium sp. vgs-9]|uniref:GcrA family cell cycle regulator n=1 Tax=Bradyrhizobium sp. vgs-9 TaxID=208389 RepID=UPI0035D3F6AE